MTVQEMGLAVATRRAFSMTEKYESMDKSEVARRQLGAALDMFLNGRDPISAHCLAVGGGEISEWLAQKAGAETFTTHALLTFPKLTVADLQSIRRRHWNAFKHATTQNGKDRDDAEILDNFDQSHNEHALFIGWYDYSRAGLPLPIEVQVFEAWYFAKYPEKAALEADTSAIDRFFPALATLSTEQQHTKLIDGIRKARKRGVVMSDPRTDRRPLTLPWCSRGQ